MHCIINVYIAIHCIHTCMYCYIVLIHVYMYHMLSCIARIAITSVSVAAVNVWRCCNVGTSVALCCTQYSSHTIWEVGRKHTEALYLC